MKTLLSWSSGKDSAWALHLLRNSAEFDVSGLLTTVNGAADRVAMHGVRRDILVAQAAAARLPLTVVDLPWPCSNENYQTLMGGAVRDAIAQGFEAVAFGDLYLEDIRAYRERQLAGTGLVPVFPLWGRPTAGLANEMISGGLKARLAVIDGTKLAPAFAGREFDGGLLADLPAGIDPCGENGEFHTCVYDGPMFSAPLKLKSGAPHDSDGFVFADLELVTG